MIPELDDDGADTDQRGIVLFLPGLKAFALMFFIFTLVAHAPRNLNRKIPTLDELEHDVKAALPTSDVSIC